MIDSSEVGPYISAKWVHFITVVAHITHRFSRRPLFLGGDYERYFDRFEVFLALVYADLNYKPERMVRGPLGRFGWKYRSRNKGGNPYIDILEEAERQKDDWPPLRANLFLGSYERFVEIASKYQELLNNLSWS